MAGHTIAVSSRKRIYAEGSYVQIGEFSKLSRISIRMLRHYDEIGLLVPEETDPWTGYRRYAAAS